jgi:hypothetical protein
MVVGTGPGSFPVAGFVLPDSITRYLYINSRKDLPLKRLLSWMFQNDKTVCTIVPTSLEVRP